MRANFAPLFAALDALVQVAHALLNVTVEHIILVNFLAATADDLVADFCQKALHSLHAIVVLAQFKDDADVLKHLR